MPIIVYTTLIILTLKYRSVKIYLSDNYIEDHELTPKC